MTKLDRSVKNHHEVTNQPGEPGDIAIENASLYEITRRQLEDLTILHKVAVAGTTASSEDDLLNHAIQIIDAVLNFDVLSVLLIESSANTLTYHTATIGLSSSELQSKMHGFMKPRKRQTGSNLHFWPRCHMNYAPRSIRSLDLQALSCKSWLAL